jgi:hypothetical protein
MKKILVFVSLISATQIVYAAKPEQPWLLTPASATPLPLATPVTFTWANTKPSPRYRFVISSTPDFSGYNQKTNTCRSKTTCFTTMVTKLTYLLSNTNAVLKPDNNYYWRVEAVNNSGESSISDIRAFTFGSPTVALDAKYAVVAPIVTNVPPSPASVEQGNPITLAVTLDVALPAGYSVKVDYGYGLVAMTGSGTSFTLTVTPSKSASYNIGIYDSKNVLKSNKVSGNFEVTAPILANVAPVLTLKSTVSKIAKIDTNKIYTVELSASDGNGNLRQINMEWGDGSSDLVSVTDGETVSLTHIYTTVSTPTWKATALDYSDTTPPSNVSNEVFQLVTVSAPVVPIVTPPVITPPVIMPPATVPPVPNYTRISIDGSANPSSVAKWGCSQDIKSKLMWEIKTKDGGLHDEDWTYSWLEPDMTKNGGYRGVENGGICKGTKCNTDAFIKAANAEKLCGKDTWRLPTKEELKSLVICPLSAIAIVPPNGFSTTYQANEISDICVNTNSPLDSYNLMPTIDTDYFPNTRTDWYWTSETYIPTLSKPTPPLCPKPPIKPTVGSPSPTCTIKLPVYDSAWNVSFYDSHVSAANKGNAARVRLVSGDNSPATTIP